MDYFFYNTDADGITDVPKPRFRVLIEKGFAAAGGQRKYGEKFKRLAEGAILLMYENRVGVVAVGRVKEQWDEKSYDKPRYYTLAEMRRFKSGAGPEYRIAVDWFVDVSASPITVNELQKRLGYKSGWAPSQSLVLIADEHRNWAAKLVEQLRSKNRLPDKEADQDPAYVPQDTDRREVVERQIRERRGQQQFRDALCQRYARRCLITESDVLAVLEAAHITPYRGEDDNHVANGLLLRSDIHTLFDLNLIGIEPDELRVELHPKIRKDAEYGKLAGKVLCCGQAPPPSREALRKRYEQFQHLSR